MSFTSYSIIVHLDSLLRFLNHDIAVDIRYKNNCSGVRFHFMNSVNLIKYLLIVKEFIKKFNDLRIRIFHKIVLFHLPEQAPPKAGK